MFIEQIFSMDLKALFKFKNFFTRKKENHCGKKEKKTGKIKKIPGKKGNFFRGNPKSNGCERKILFSVKRRL